MSTISPSFIEMLTSETPNISEIVMSESFIIAINVKFQYLLDFFKKNGLCILNEIAKEENSETSAKLYRIILSADADFLFQLILSQGFVKELLNIINNENTSKDVKIRMSNIITAFLIRIPNAISPNYPIIDSIFDHIEDNLFYYLIESLVTSDKIPIATLNYLKKVKIYEKIYFLLMKLKEIPSDTEENSKIYGKNDTKRLNLLQLATKCSLNSILVPYFKCDKFTKAIGSQPKNLPSYIKSAQWSAMRHTATQKVPNCLLDYVTEAAEIVKEVKEVDHVYGYHSSALMFINHILLIEPQETADLLAPMSAFLNDAVSGIIRFPNSTNLHISFRIFVDVALHIRGLAEFMCPIYMPIFIKYAEGRENKVLAATFNDLIMKMIDAGKESNSIKESLRPVQEFPIYATTELAEYKKMIKENYGIEPPRRLYKFFAKFFE